ncbi:Unknown protein [Striga hermonthica]|uniref:Transposase n=1 Tax=Striga hermonthica TaxID=68872 RepID=A0A9N7MF21_STRHE|nr:Unknown protein [Striga hermonthica]
MPSASQTEEIDADDADMYDRVEDMINDVGAESFEQAHVNKVCESLSVDAEKPLYGGCKNFSRLTAILKLINLKAANGWSDKSFTELLCLLKEMLPEDNELPKSNYDAKKVLCPLGLGYRKIHACPNDCILYRNEYTSLEECPECGVSRFKNEADADSSTRVQHTRPPAKGYVKNPHRPEASIVERYVAEEVVEFCTEYLSRAKSVGLPKSRHVGRSPGKGTLGGRMKSVDREELLQAHLYILTNTPEVQPYLDTHRRLIKEKNPRKAERWLVNEHNKTFISWFKNEVANCPSASNTVSWLAAGPNFDIISWRGYDINGYSFYTKERDEKSTMQNSGVSVEAESMHFSSAKDKNPLCASSSYFGIIEEIWELNYVKFTVPVFKCKWVDSNNGVKVDELGFTLVDFRKVGYKNEPFIMASQAKQVFYVIDPSNENCSVVLHGKRQVSDDDKNDLTIDVSEFPSTRSRIAVENEEVERMEDFNSDDAHSDSTNESNHSQKDCRKGGRGATRLPHLMLQSGKKRKISFDCDMQPDGPTIDIITDFISCVGLLARSTASILAENWKDGVPDKIKEQIWQTLEEIFELPNDKKLKEYWLRRAGENWRSFKTSLNRYISGKQKGQLPYIKTYPYLDKDTWEAFVASRQTPEFLDYLEEQSSQGNFKPSGRNDILAEAIGKPEHPGRVRGVRKGVGIKAFFGRSNRPSAGAGMVSRQELDVIISQVKEEVAEQVKGEVMKMMQLGSQPGISPSSPVILSTKGSGTPALDVSKDGEEYELYLEDPQRRLVAYGHVHNLGSTMHHRMMKDGDVRVVVSRVIVGDAFVPYPTDEVTFVRDAPSQFIAWPRNLVAKNLKLVPRKNRI